jgi:hypothetical protein
MASKQLQDRLGDLHKVLDDVIKLTTSLHDMAERGDFSKSFNGDDATEEDVAMELAYVVCDTADDVAIARMVLQRALAKMRVGIVKIKSC